jgi:hypothetical protein
MASNRTIELARRNGTGAWQYAGADARPVSVDHVVALLADAADRDDVVLRRTANALLDAMASYAAWRIVASASSGDAGSADYTPYIQLDVAHRQFRLQLATVRRIRRITDDMGVAPLPAWLAPGAPVAPRRL